MIGFIERDKSGKPINAQVSAYNPPIEVKNRTEQVKQDYEIGHTIMHRGWREFNDKSILEQMNSDQRAFNSYVPPRSNDPDESWRIQTVRPITRNKIISIAAQVTANLMVPKAFAQNTNDEEDKQAANVMNDLIEWTIKNSDYEYTMLHGIISALVNPALILKAEFAQVMQTIKAKNERGEITDKQVVDEILSGFQTHIVPVEELFIANIYEHEIQRQRFLIRRRFISFDEAEAIYGEFPNFKFVKPGVNVLFSEEDELFYEQKDDSLARRDLVEEAIYYNRREDVQIPFINGVVPDNAMINHSMLHRDNQNRPKYPFAKTGYEPIDEKRFFYFKSAVSKLGPDQNLVDTLYNMLMDGTFRLVMPSYAVFGDEDVDSSIAVPGTITNFSKNTKIEPIVNDMNIQAGFAALEKVESSITESSQDSSRAGVAGAGGRTAFEISRLEQNARIQLGLFGKMIAKLVIDFGNLMVDDILRHMTVGAAEELLGGQVRLKFRTFLLPDQTDRGKKVTKRIIFTDEFTGIPLGDEEELKRSFALMEEEGGLDADKRIIKVNPALFAKLKFKIFVQADSILPKSEALEKVLNLEAYDRMIINPFTDQKAVTQDFLVEAFAKGESDKYMKKQEAVPIQQGELPPGQAPGQTSPQVRRLSGSNIAADILNQ